MEEMVEAWAPFMTEDNRMDLETARKLLADQLPHLKRWKQ